MSATHSRGDHPGSQVSGTIAAGSEGSRARIGPGGLRGTIFVDVHFQVLDAEAAVEEAVRRREGLMKSAHRGHQRGGLGFRRPDGLFEDSRRPGSEALPLLRRDFRHGPVELQ